MIHYCENCEQLEKELAEALRQRDEAREQANRATDLMMKGEALRGRMMLQAIVGEFPPGAQKE
jgi:F0F1-type ATP synthase membrane subunit b/b'